MNSMNSMVHLCKYRYAVFQVLSIPSGLILNPEYFHLDLSPHEIRFSNVTNIIIQSVQLSGMKAGAVNFLVGVTNVNCSFSIPALDT